MVLDYKATISRYEALKRQVEAAIKDEQDAQRMYGDMSNAAMNVSIRNIQIDYIADQIRSIRDDEIRHEKSFRTIMVSIDTAIDAAKKEEADKKRKEEAERIRLEQRKKSQAKDPNRRYGR